MDYFSKILKTIGNHKTKISIRPYIVSKGPTQSEAISIMIEVIYLILKVPQTKMIKQNPENIILLSPKKARKSTHITTIK